MSENPGQLTQEGASDITPESATQTSSLLERLKQLPSDIARSDFIDNLLRRAGVKDSHPKSFPMGR